MIAKDIMNEIKNLDPPGRFLNSENKSFFEWYEVGDNECVDKVCEVLREKAKIGKKKRATEEDKQIAHLPIQFLLIMRQKAIVFLNYLCRVPAT